MKVLQRAKELEAAGRKIVHMEVGEPDFTTATPIIEAARQALSSGHTHYSNAAGIEPLREAISGFYQQRYGITVNRSRIFVTPGASGGLNLLANLLINPGDGILLADPAYPCNRNYIRLMGGEPQLIPVAHESAFQPTVDLLDQFSTASTAGLWLASPANPSGTIIERQRLQSLQDWAAGKDLHTVMDEIYHGLHYVEDMPSLLELSADGFVVNSFSKYFGMTGWRIGWIVVPEQFIEPVNTLAQNLFIAASTIAQHAALAAFDPATEEIFESRRQAFRDRRDFLTQALRDIGFSIPHVTEGAFYLYAGIDKFSDDSEEFCQRMLEQHGVAITPGTDFGDNQAHGYVRFAFTTDMDDLRLGVDRLHTALVS
ncbi:MAG: aminotransferase class I/II-fold pyridoxal phosphate-dependent enzyme [Gammaproteobacteria bacterium]|nr:aminotransferase class I/II-fold pyridoxal phosphate-dependent enzyme [Gammaproteobacteria bacterium]